MIIDGIRSTQENEMNVDKLLLMVSDAIYDVNACTWVSDNILHLSRYNSIINEFAKMHDLLIQYLEHMKEYQHMLLMVFTSEAFDEDLESVQIDELEKFPEWSNSEGFLDDVLDFIIGDNESVKCIELLQEKIELIDNVISRENEIIKSVRGVIIDFYHCLGIRNQDYYDRLYGFIYSYNESIYTIAQYSDLFRKVMMRLY